jgi:hypothetical protein
LLLASCSDNSTDNAAGGDGGAGGSTSSAGGTGTGGSTPAVSGNGGSASVGSGGGNAGSGGQGGAGGAAIVRSCKRGIAYGYHSVADLTALSAGVTWWYNWATIPDQDVKDVYTGIGVDFVPMVWGGNFDAGQVTAAIPSGAKYLLAFNEPNFFSQANLSATEAAALWPLIEDIADAKGLEIVSPAVNFCGGGCHETSPFAYLDAFFAACQNCRVDYIAAHWYACDGPALTWYLGELKKYGRPIWLTEFSCGDGMDLSLDVQTAYMKDAVVILEADPDVFRYAWFAGRTTAIPNVNLLGASGQLTSLGQQYVSLPYTSGCGP